MKMIEQRKKKIGALTTAVIAVLGSLAVFYAMDSIPGDFKQYLIIGAAAMCALFIIVMFQEQIKLMKELAEAKEGGGIFGIIGSILGFLLSMGIIVYMVINRF